TVRVEPVQFDLSDSAVDLPRRLTVDVALRYSEFEDLIESAPFSFELGDAREQRLKVEMLSCFLVLLKLGNELFEIVGVERKVERQYFRVREPQRKHSPQFRHQRVITITRIADLVHPVEIVVHRM